jgi:hypothetical protein
MARFADNMEYRLCLHLLGYRTSANRVLHFQDGSKESDGSSSWGWAGSNFAGNLGFNCVEVTSTVATRIQASRVPTSNGKGEKTGVP